MSRLGWSSWFLILLLLSGCAAEVPEPAAESVSEPAAEPPPPALEEEAEPSTPEVAFKDVRRPFEDRHLLTGGQPTSEELAALAAAGYKTVVNLRPETEEGAWDEGPELEELGVRYVHIPVAGPDGINVENARRLAEIVDDESAYPLVVHCASGNRVGALLAMKAFHLDGVDADTALEIGLDAGLTRLEPVVRERLAGGEPPAAP